MPKHNLFLTTYRFLFLFIFGILCSFSSLYGQKNTESDVSISSIEVIYENFKTVDRAFVLSHIPIKEGVFTIAPFRISPCGLCMKLAILSLLT